MSAQTRDLLTAMSIMASAENLFSNYTDNVTSKDENREFFGLLLTITTQEFHDEKVIREIDGVKQTFSVSNIIIKAQKSPGGCEKVLRLNFNIKFKRFIDSLVHKDKHELIIRYREELRNASIDAFSDDNAQDQAQIRVAFDAFSEILRVLKIRSTAETAQNIDDAEKRIREMYERAISATPKSKEESEEE